MHYIIMYIPIYGTCGDKCAIILNYYCSSIKNKKSIDLSKNIKLAVYDRWINVTVNLVCVLFVTICAFCNMLFL